MSSFKRRLNPTSGTSNAPLPAGVKTSSFSSPVPLISTGVPALDDLLSGGGLSSSSDLLIFPSTGTAAQSAAQIGASSSTPAASAETDHAARAAAEPYTELLLGYSIAQGIASGHVGIVVGEDARGLVGGATGRAGDLDERVVEGLGSKSSVGGQEEAIAGPSDHLDTVADEDDAEQISNTSAQGEPASEEGKLADPQREREMKIAWRYHSMKQFNTTVNSPSNSEPIPFCQTFDLSKRIDPRIVQHAIDRGTLELVDISTASSSSGIPNSYDAAYARIEAAAERCRRLAASSPSTAPPVLRVAIRALGSPSWTVPRGRSRHVEIIRFLHRLRRLLRTLSLPSSTPTHPFIPSIAIITISPYLLSTPLPVNLPHRLLHSVDSAISLSTFSTSPTLRSAFSAYTGALKVLKTPAVGTLTNPSIRSSVLRGMGSGAGAKAGGEGGAGGGENNLAFKVRRKRLVIETLHLDVEGGVSERRTKPAKGVGEEGEKKGAGVPSKVDSGVGAGGSSFVRRRPEKAESETMEKRTVAGEKQPAPAPAGPKKFAGLSSLRQRGLAAAAAAGTSEQVASQKEYAVEVESGHQKHQHAHSRSSAPANRVANTRAEDLEF